MAIKQLIFILASNVWLLWPAQACSLRMGIETNFSPYIVQQQNSWSGLNVELLQALAADVGCQLEFIHSPWLRSLKLAEQQQLDVVSQLSYNSERNNQFAFIGPHFIEKIYLVGQPAAFKGLTAVSQLKKNGTSGIIALLNGAYYGDELDAILNDAANHTRFVFIRGNEDKLALLLNNRVHGVLEDITAFHYWQQDIKVADHSYQPILLLYQSPVYFGFNRLTISEQQLQRLAESWQKLYANGVLQRIVQRYDLPQYQLSLPAPASILSQQ